MSDPFDPRDPSTGHLDDDMAVELALGLATGRDRAGSLAHLVECSSCRGRVDGLRETGDGLLLLAPPAEPPAGFEQDVLASLRAARPSAAPRRLRPMLLAAAALLVVAAIGIGIVLGQRASSPSDGLSTATMRTPAGVDVGTVWRHPGQPSWLFVSVPGWRHWEADGDGGREYRLQLTLSDGRKVTLDDTFLRPDDGTWASTLTGDADHVAAVAVVDETGRVWCTGRFTTSA